MQGLCRASRSLRGLRAGGEAEGRADGHHLRVHGERRVGVVAAAGAFEGGEGGAAGALLAVKPLRRSLGLGLHLVLHLRHPRALLELRDGGAVEGAGGEGAGLQRAAVEAGAVSVEALADDLATADND